MYKSEIERIWDAKDANARAYNRTWAGYPGWHYAPSVNDIIEGRAKTPYQSSTGRNNHNNRRGR